MGNRRPVSRDRGLRGTASHVVWGGTVRTRWEKGSRAQGDRKSRGFGVGNRGPGGKRDRGLRGPEVTWFLVGNR